MSNGITTSIVKTTGEIVQSFAVDNKSMTVLGSPGMVYDLDKISLGKTSLVINTTPISGIAAGDLLTSNGYTLQKLTPGGTLVVQGGALGTPSGGTLTSCTGLPVGGITATGTPGSTTYLRGDGQWYTPAGGVSPGGSSGQFQYNNGSGGLAASSTLTFASSLPVIGDGGATPATNRLIVNNTAAGGKDRKFCLSNGNWYSTAVPFLQPQSDSSGIAFDIMPKGSAADCWIDICSTDVVADSANFETLSLKKLASSDAIIQTTAAGNGTVHSIRMQTLGGGVIIGYNGPPVSMLDVYGGLSVGQYAGSVAAPTNGALISGVVGINTSAPLSGLQLDVNGVIGAGYLNGSGEFKAWASAQSATSYFSLKAEAGSPYYSGIYNGGTSGFMLYYNGGTGDTVLNATFSGSPIKFAYQGTELARITAAGSLVIGTAALNTTATDGFPYIPGGAGPPTGTPTSHTGTYPLYWDHTDKKLYIYDGSWLGATAPGVWS